MLPFEQETTVINKLAQVFFSKFDFSQLIPLSLNVGLNEMGIVLRREVKASNSFVVLFSLLIETMATDLIERSRHWTKLVALGRKIGGVGQSPSEIRELIQTIKKLPWVKDSDELFTIPFKNLLIGYLKPKLRTALAREFALSCDEMNISSVSCVSCGEAAEARDVGGPASCKCFLCKECTTTFVKYALKNVREEKILCPKCRFPVQLDYLARNGATSSEVVHYCELLRARIDTARVPCPTPDCPGGTTQEQVEKSPYFNCEFCEFSGCVRCNQMHTGECANHKEPQVDKDTNDLLGQQIKRGAVIKCPKCSNFVEKNGGCPSMVCFACGEKWKWQ